MNRVIEFLTENIDFNKDLSIVIGVSGGPDSMCLLDILLKIRENNNFNIIVCHINHKVRKESDEEELFLKKYCSNNNIIFESKSILEKVESNFEMYARNFRYDFYNELIKKYNAKYLMTAHHGDDLIETIMMKIVRGGTLQSNVGIKLVNQFDGYQLVRPLLFVTKKQIEEYLDSNNIEYRIDKSNFSNLYTRNRYRSELLPFLKNEDENVHLKFLKFSNNLDECCNYVEKEVSLHYNNCYTNYLDLVKFNKLDIFLKKRIIEKILFDLYKNSNIISSKHVEMIIDLCLKDDTGIELKLPKNIVVLKDYEKIKFIKKNIKNDYKILLDDNINIGNFLFKKYDGLDYGNDTLHIDSKSVKLPLYIRNRKDGDFIELKGSGKKKVKDIFIDSKISIDERDSYPLIVDSNDVILWVPKLKKSKYDVKKDEYCDIIYKCI